MRIKYKISFVVDKKYNTNTNVNAISIALPMSYQLLSTKTYNDLQNKKYIELTYSGVKFKFKETVVIYY